MTWILLEFVFGRVRLARECPAEPIPVAIDSGMRTTSKGNHVLVLCVDVRRCSPRLMSNIPQTCKWID